MSQPVATLAEIRRHFCWVMAYCLNRHCLHSRPLALTPIIIRFGPDASSDVIRERAKCERCGQKGATLQMPSWGGLEVGARPFPT